MLAQVLDLSHRLAPTLQRMRAEDIVPSRRQSPSLGELSTTWGAAMSLTVTINIQLVPVGEYRMSIPLAEAPVGRPSGVQREEDARRVDRVLPLGSSTLSPGLRLPLA